MTKATTEWERCKPYIAAAVALVDTHTIADVEKGLCDQRYQFWPGEKSAAITEVWQYPQARYLHIPFAGGDLDELRAMVPSFMSWGRHLGCSKVTLAGRAGWERALKHQGWEKGVVCLALDIPPELKQ